jgi:hypothetical protein
MLPYKIHLAIVGSRTFTDKKRFDEWVTDALTGWGATVKDIGNIISGGACGADTLAEQYARENNLSLVVYRPDWKTHGRAAGILRNTDIVQASTHVIAFPSRAGRGTQDSMKKALGLKKITKVYYID